MVTCNKVVDRFIIFQVSATILKLKLYHIFQMVANLIYSVYYIVGPEWHSGHSDDYDSHSNQFDS